MSISSVPDYNTLKADIITTIASQSVLLYNKYANGIVTAYDKLRFMLLIMYVNYIFDNDVYETYVDTRWYEEGDFVEGTYSFFLCIKDIDAGSIPLTNREYWSPNVSFTYDYDTMLDNLNKINRICATNFEI